jgi:hypothetical protein
VALVRRAVEEGRAAATAEDWTGVVGRGELEKAALEVADYLADAEARIVAAFTGGRS